MVPKQQAQPIYIITGGVGASGELLVRTVLAQFPEVQVPVTICPNVHDGAQLARIVEQAAAVRATLVHTLVDTRLREQLVKLAASYSLTSVDLLGRLIDHLGVELGVAPLGQPGRYRTQERSYFKRIEAIQFAVHHDDGKRVEDLPAAEIVLLGVSRVGKTPIAIYLSVQGWKVANVPLVPELPLPESLARVPRGRVVGLTIEPRQLLVHRRTRQRTIGISGGGYADLSTIVESLRAANHLFYQAGYPIIDVTDKPIESITEEVLAAVTGEVGQHHEAAL